MKASHANLLLEEKARMPMKGDTCDMSCQFAFACANMKDGEPCQGFQLLSNGKISRIIRQNLAEYDEEYIQNCVRLIQNGTTPETEEAMVQEVYRYIIPPKQREGFIGMLESAFERHTDEPEFHAKATAHNQEPAISFFKYHNKPEYPQKTNREIQEEMQQKESEKKDE